MVVEDDQVELIEFGEGRFETTDRALQP